MSKHIPRIFCNALKDDIFRIPEYHTVHVVSVMRLKEGSQFLAFNSEDGEWLCAIESIKKSEIIARKIELIRTYKPTKPVAIGICIIKPDNLKLVIEKCTELGVTDFYLIRSKYTNATCNLEKLKLISILATEQSERLDIPKLHEEMNIKEFVCNLPEGYKWYSAIERLAPKPYSITSEPTGFIIGPEGGFSESEKDLLKSYTTPICISKNVLRSETAAIVCAAISELFAIF